DADRLFGEEGHFMPYGHVILDDEVGFELKATADVESTVLADVEVLPRVAVEMGHAPKTGRATEAQSDRTERVCHHTRAHEGGKESEQGLERAESRGCRLVASR